MGKAAPDRRGGSPGLGHVRLELSVAIGDYDRVRPLVDGSVQIDGVRPVFMLLSPEEIFFRAMRHADFDVCELSLSSFALRTARGDNPYVGVPVFPSRTFRHTSIVVRTDRDIRTPEDLRGRRLGTPEYQLTACVWARGLLSDEFGVRPSEVIWVRGGMEQPGRVEKIDVQLPEGIRLETAPADRTLSQLLEQGDIDGLVGPRLPAGFGKDPRIGWLFADPMGAALDYYRRTGIFPIMHLLGVRRSLAERHPWLPAALAKAFELAKAAAFARLSDTSATKVMLPFVEELLLAVRREMGEDYWPYGLERNRKTLETFLRLHHEQGLSARRLAPQELFHPASLETFRI
jgi:4,5-dihydroxyphthalate decarboxylase